MCDFVPCDWIMQRAYCSFFSGQLFSFVFKFNQTWVDEISGRNYMHETGLSLRGVSRNTCYAWGCLIFPWCYGWNSLLFKEFTHKVTNLLWVWRIRLQVTKKLMTTLQNCPASISFLRPTCLLVADQKTCGLWEQDCHVLNQGMHALWYGTPKILESGNWLFQSSMSWHWPKDMWALGTRLVSHILHVWLHCNADQKKSSLWKGCT